MRKEGKEGSSVDTCLKLDGPIVDLDILGIK